jgi:hypothetical protein
LNSCVNWIVHRLGGEAALQLLDLAHLALQFAVEALELPVDRDALLALALGAVARLARVTELVLRLEQEILGARAAGHPLLRHVEQAHVPRVRLLVAAYLRVAHGGCGVGLAQRRHVLALLGDRDRVVERGERERVVVARIGERSRGPARIDGVVAAREVRQDRLGLAHAARGIVDAAVQRVDLGADRHEVSLRLARHRRRRLGEHRVDRRERAVPVAGAELGLGEVRAREQQHLRVVVARKHLDRVLRELARGRVVADGHERRGEVRHRGREVRRHVDRAQRLEREVQVADRLVDAVVVEVRRREHVDRPEAVLRRQRRVGLVVDREDLLARVVRHLPHQRESRRADAREELAADARRARRSARAPRGSWSPPRAPRS